MERRLQTTTFSEKIGYNFPEKGNQGRGLTGQACRALQPNTVIGQSIVKKQVLKIG